MSETRGKSKLHHYKERIKHHVKRGVSKVRQAVPRRRRESVPSSYPLIEKKTLNRIVAALSYVHILVIVSLILGRKNSHIRFHAKQGMVLLVLWVVTLFVFWSPIAAALVGAVTVVLMIVGIVHALKGRERPLPYIGRLAEK